MLKLYPTPCSCSVTSPGGSRRTSWLLTIGFGRPVGGETALFRFLFLVKSVGIFVLASNTSKQHSGSKVSTPPHSRQSWNWPQSSLPTKNVGRIGCRDMQRTGCQIHVQLPSAHPPSCLSLVVLKVSLKADRLLCVLRAPLSMSLGQWLGLSSVYWDFGYTKVPCTQLSNLYLKSS